MLDCRVGVEEVADLEVQLILVELACQGVTVSISNPLLAPGDRA